MPSKNKCQKTHFKRRLKQRYGLNIGKEGIKKIIDMIKNGNAEFVEKQSNRISIFNVEYEEEKIRVVYDKNRKNLVSALPCE